MRRPAKLCAVCGETGRPMVTVKDSVVCLECAKMLGLLVEDGEQDRDNRK